MVELTNRDAINRGATLIATWLLDNYPVATVLDIALLAPAADENTQRIYAGVVNQLIGFGVMEGRSVASNGHVYWNAVLTMRGLAFFDAVPSTMKSGPTRAQSIKSAVAKGGVDVVVKVGAEFLVALAKSHGLLP